MKYNPLEGTDGTTITVANSDDNGGDALALVSLNGETGAYETTNAIFGTSSLRLASATATNTVQVGFTDTASTSARARWYERFTTIPTALQQHGVNFRGASGATTVSRMEVNSADGKFRCVMGGTTGSYSALGLSTAVDYEFEAVVSGANGSSGTMTINCYLKSDGSLFTSATVSGATTAVTIDTCRFGKFNGSGNFDCLIDAIAFETGSAVEIGPYLRTINVVDAQTQLEGTSNISHSRSDTLTQSETSTVLNVALAVADILSQTEDVTETTATDVSDVQHVSDVVTSLTVTASRTDVQRLGDSPSGSVPTGPQGISWGGGFDTDYVVVTEADSSDLAAGQKTVLYTSGGVAKEETVFTITSLSPPFAGFVNVFLDQRAAVLPAAGDVLKVVVPAGASVARSTPSTDAWTLSGEIAAVARASERTDVQTLSQETASVTVSGVVLPATETDVARPVARAKARAAAIAAETDAAQPAVARRKFKATGVAADVETALPLTARHVRAVGVAAETDTSTALTDVRTRATGLTSETDVARPVGARHSRVLGVPAELDAAGEVSSGTGVHLASEEDAALPLVARKSKTVSTAAEVDAALTPTRRVGRTLGVAAETDVAPTVLARKLRAVAQTSTTDASLAVGRRLVRSVGVVAEVDVASTFAASKTAVVGRVDETDVARSVVGTRVVPVGLPPTDLCVALPLARGKTRAVARAAETDVARPTPPGVPGQPVTFRIGRRGREGVTSASGNEPGHLS